MSKAKIKQSKGYRICQAEKLAGHLTNGEKKQIEKDSTKEYKRKRNELKINSKIKEAEEQGLI